MNTLLIGAGSGLATAVLFFSASRGNVLFATILLFLTPLPMLIAGASWGVAAAVAGASAGAAIVALTVSLTTAVTFLIALGIPAILIAHLTDLGRPSPDGQSIEWFPAGGILAALGAYAGFVPLYIAMMLGGSFAPVKPRLLLTVTEIVKRFEGSAGAGAKAVAPADANAITDTIIASLPAVLAGYWLVIFAVNVYLAGRVARASGRLPRPWPDLHQLAAPAWLALGLAVAIILSMMSGPLRLAGTAYTGALLVTYAVFGLSVLHAIAAGRVQWLLWLTYAALFNPLGPYAMLAVALIGLTEPILNFRHRFGKKPPPTPPAVV